MDILRDGEEEKEAHVPASVLGAKAVAREMVFSSLHVMEGFRVEQSVALHGQEIESFEFEFGFVMPESTNTWSSTIVAADAADMIPADVLSGNVVIQMRFFNNQDLIASANVRVFYDG